MSLNLEKVYEYRFRSVDQQARQRVWNVIAGHIYTKLGLPERLLDPAAGRCEFLNGLADVERWAVDLTDQHGEGRDPAIKIVVGDALQVELPHAYFGGVFISNFLEHLESHDEVARLLARMHDVMEPGGRIAIMGPNFRHCSKDYFDCADHVLAMTHVAVEEHLYASGFEIENVTSRFIPYSFRGLLPPSARLTAAYLAFPPAWKLLGKQFLLVGRKPLTS